MHPLSNKLPLHTSIPLAHHYTGVVLLVNALLSPVSLLSEVFTCVCDSSLSIPSQTLHSPQIQSQWHHGNIWGLLRVIVNENARAQFKRNVTLRLAQSERSLNSNLSLPFSLPALAKIIPISFWK